jgi:hypothetical protein
LCHIWSLLDIKYTSALMHLWLVLSIQVCGSEEGFRLHGDRFYFEIGWSNWNRREVIIAARIIFLVSGMYVLHWRGLLVFCQKKKKT